METGSFQTSFLKLSPPPFKSFFYLLCANVAQIFVGTHFIFKYSVNFHWHEFQNNQSPSMVLGLSPLVNFRIFIIGAIWRSARWRSVFKSCFTTFNMQIQLVHVFFYWKYFFLFSINVHEALWQLWQQFSMKECKTLCIHFIINHRKTY